MENYLDKISIIGTGSYVPEKIITNFDLEKILDTSDEWITSRTGIKERHVAAPSEAASDLAAKAGIRALKKAEVEPSEVELLIVATQSSDYIFPSAACVTQQKLGLNNAVCFDIAAACSGAAYAFIMADAIMKGGGYETAMVIGVDIFSRLVDWQDRSSCILFGDGAGAVIMKKKAKGGKILSYDWGSDGSKGDILQIPAGGSRYPLTAENVDQAERYIQMDGQKVYKFAVSMMVDSVNKALKKIEMTESDIDILIPHQANKRIIESVARDLHLPMSNVFVNVGIYGNTSAASIPIALDEALIQNRIQDRDIVVLTACGGGLTWGSLVLDWEK